MQCVEMNDHFIHIQRTNYAARKYYIAIQHNAVNYLIYNICKYFRVNKLTLINSIFFCFIQFFPFRNFFGVYVTKNYI